MIYQLNSIQFLLNTIFDVLSFLFMLRMWFQYCRVDFYSPFSQSLVKFTNPIILPLQKVLLTIKNVNFAPLFVVFVLGVLKYHMIFAIVGARFPIGQSVIIALLHTLRTFGELFLYILFLGAILSWFNRGALSYLLHQLGEPLLKPVRRLLPRTGMIDFSPMLLAFILFYGNRVMYDLLGNYWALA